MLIEGKLEIGIFDIRKVPLFKPSIRESEMAKRMGKKHPYIFFSL